MRWQDIPPLPQGNYTVNVPLWGLKDYIDRLRKDCDCPPKSTFDLDPEFQRGHVWTEAQQISFMEWLCRGGESGRVILCNQPGWMNTFNGPFQLVDGKQRLTAALRFLDGDLPIFGHYVNEFENTGGFDPSFIWTVGVFKTQVEVLEWYLSFNSGGTMHTPEELSRVRGLLEKARKAETKGGKDG